MPIPLRYIIWSLLFMTYICNYIITYMCFAQVCQKQFCHPFVSSCRSAEYAGKWQFESCSFYHRCYWGEDWCFPFSSYIIVPNLILEFRASNKLSNNLRSMLVDYNLQWVQLESKYSDDLQYHLQSSFFKSDLNFCGFWSIFYNSESNFQLPTEDQLKTVLDKVKDFFGDAKESFGKLTALNSTTTEESEEKPKEAAKWV